MCERERDREKKGWNCLPYIGKLSLNTMSKENKNGEEREREQCTTSSLVGKKTNDSITC